MTERRVLDNWKEIAAYLGRTGKTCRNWEKEYGLPVHRLDGSPRAHVFAYADEVDRWKEEMLKVDDAGKARRFLGFSRLSRRTRLGLLVISACVSVAAAGLFIREMTKKGGVSGARDVKGIGILPFIDLSPGKEYEYLCDGMVETLINTLSRLEGLRIPGQASAFYFKGKDVPLQEVGKKLSVEYVLRASVQVDGEQLRVIPSLIKVADGSLVWSEKYDKRRADIFAVEDDIARMVADSLKVIMIGGKRSPLIKPGTANPEAYNFYLQGRYLWSKRGCDNLRKAMDYFKKALELEPRFALAYAGIAQAYGILVDNLCLSPREGLPKAQAYAVKALEIDNSLADAHAMVEFSKPRPRLDHSGAERARKAVIELDPKNAYLHQSYAVFLSALGRHDEAIKEIRLARDLDPLALRIRANVGYFLYLARRYSEAEQELKKELEFEPGNLTVYTYLAFVYGETGRYQEALEYFLRAPFQEAGHSWISPRVASIYARMGKDEEARKVLQELEHLREDGIYISTAHLAVAYGWLGENDKAFSLLEEAVTEGDPRLNFFKVEPWFDCLRSDLRFADLLRRFGLEEQ